MEGIIEVVSSTGLGFRINGQARGSWYNKGKMVARDFKGLAKGDKIQFDAPDGKWVTAWKKDGEAGDAGTATSAPSVSDNVSKVFAGKSDSKSDGMARGCAAHAVFESPYIGETLKGDSMEETMQNLKDFATQLSEWVYSGKWG
jgi:hypothetical protein